MKAKVFSFVFALFMTLGFIASANATVIHNSRAIFEGTLGASITDDYEDSSYVFNQSNAAMTAVLGETSYTSTGHNNINIVFNSAGSQRYCAGCNGSYLLDFTSTSVGSASGVFGAGFDIFSNLATRDGSYYAYVTFGDASTSNYLLSNGGSFWGITSSLLISSIHVGMINGGTTIDGSFSHDNLTIGAAAVDAPEPVTLALLGLGLVGIGFNRGRKQQ